MGIDDRFHLKAGDVFATAQHTIFHAINKIEVSIIIEFSSVAGVEPHISKSLERCIRHSEIFVNHD